MEIILGYKPFYKNFKLHLGGPMKKLISLLLIILVISLCFTAQSFGMFRRNTQRASTLLNSSTNWKAHTRLFSQFTDTQKLNYALPTQSQIMVDYQYNNNLNFFQK